ncbi:MAG: GspH/FimT family pseudopilin [Proteobacteria bacterium]|nr:GspH/FimT family pseudopilin [Pseudomonadota bacterium]
MIVIAIIGILAAMVRVSFDSQASKVKSVAFNLRGDMNFARSEAVSRNRNVRVDFFLDDDPVVADRVDLDGDGTMDDGYGIWTDKNNNGNYEAWVLAADDANGNGICDEAEVGDCLLKAVAFADEVQFYDVNATGGPLIKPGGGGIDFENGDTDDDGVAIAPGVNWLAFLPDGTSNNGGTIYIYAPSSDDVRVMKAPPLAMVVSTSTGRVRVERWRTSTGTWETR